MVTTYQQTNLSLRVWILQEHSLRDENEVQWNQGKEDDSLQQVEVQIVLHIPNYYRAIRPLES